MMWPWLVLATLALEALMGYPASLHAAVPHPVVWAGRAIDTFETAWNHPRLSFAAAVDCATAGAAATNASSVHRVRRSITARAPCE